MAPAVQIRNVSKHFKRYREKQPRTLKEKVIFWGRDKAYEEFWALKDVGFDIESGSTFGLIGANGSGKSTLLKIIAGIIRPSSGEVVSSGRMGALLEVGAGFHPDLTGRENVYLNASILGLSKKQVDREFDSIVEFAELRPFIDNQVKHYSSGMYVRLGFSVAVHMDPEILLVDEVLAVGDEGFQDKCLERIRQFQREGRTIIVVTHAVDVVKQMCDRAALLTHGQLTELGFPEEVVRSYRDQMAAVERPAEGQFESLDVVRFEEVRLLGPEGHVTDEFDAGSPMRVEAEVSVLEHLDWPVVDINLYDNSGLHVFGTNSVRRNFHFEFLPGKAKMVMEFLSLPMRDGRYFLEVGAHAADGSGTLYGKSGRILFQVISRTDEPGKLYLSCDFSGEGDAIKELREARG